MIHSVGDGDQRPASWDESMKIYTKTGDAGETGLIGGDRVAKDHPRVEACGAVDELNAALGVARAAHPPEKVERLLGRVQHELFCVGAELAMVRQTEADASLLTERHVSALEKEIDLFQSQLPPLQHFILPSGNAASAALHLARAICRRAERRVVSLRRTERGGVHERIVQYLNRLGDLLFVLARMCNAEAGQPDIPWRKDRMAGL